ncbi:MAG: hypothetical protein ACLR8Y_09790 [Alistipes indistinctus]
MRLTAAVYFDSDYQTIQSVTDLYPSGIEITSNTHDFTGNVTRTKVKQTVDNTVYEYDKWFEFDSFGRLQQVSQQITGDGANGKVVLASYTSRRVGPYSDQSDPQRTGNGILRLRPDRTHERRHLAFVQLRARLRAERRGGSRAASGR